MNLVNEADSFRQSLGSLPALGQLAFMLACGERMVPNYSAFCTEQEWGSDTALRQALEIGWSVVAGNLVARSRVQECLHNCDAAAPDTEDFRSELVSAALDAANACALVLEAVLEPSIERAIEVATLACDTVFMFAKGAQRATVGSSSLEHRTADHPLVQQELQREKEDLAVLNELDWSVPRTAPELAIFRNANTGSLKIPHV
ncbi:MAG: DUF416 family protein [Gemmatimonadaceae bacterium]